MEGNVMELIVGIMVCVFIIGTFGYTTIVVTAREKRVEKLKRYNKELDRRKEQALYDALNGWVENHPTFLLTKYCEKCHRVFTAKVFWGTKVKCHGCKTLYDVPEATMDDFIKNNQRRYQEICYNYQHIDPNAVCRSFDDWYAFVKNNNVPQDL